MNKTKRRTFSAPQKAEAVRKHLKDRTPVSQIADQMHVQPTMIHNWINTALQQMEHAFESPKTAKAESSKQDAKLKKLKEKLDVKNEVIAELMEENIRSKKENGELPRDWWLAEWERRAIIDFHDKNPLEGYRRLTFMMLDDDVVAVSPSTTYRALKTAGRLDRRSASTSSKGKGFK